MSGVTMRPDDWLPAPDPGPAVHLYCGYPMQTTDYLESFYQQYVEGIDPDEKEWLRYLGF